MGAQSYGSTLADGESLSANRMAGLPKTDFEKRAVRKQVGQQHAFFGRVRTYSEFGFMGENGSPTSVALSSFVARSGGAAPAPDGATAFGWLVLVGLTLIAFGANSPTRARLWKR